MTRRSCAVMLALAVLAGVGVQASDGMKQIVESYLEIQSRLAEDKTDDMSNAARVIGEQATAMGSEGTAIVKAAKAVERAKDLKAAREAFGPLSEAVIAAGNAAGWKDTPDIRVAYCPMVKRSWVQKEETIRNPYYGSSMLACGEFKKPK